MLAAWVLPLVSIAPNRLVSGQGVYLWSVWQALGGKTINVLFISLTVTLLLLGLALSFKPGRWLSQAAVVLVGTALLSLLALAGSCCAIAGSGGLGGR